MGKIHRAQKEFLEMDMLSAGDSPVHRLHPLAKLLATFVYIGTTVSFGKYELTGLSAMALYPVILFQLSGIPVSLCFYKLRLVLPLVCAVGIANPFLDHTPVLSVGAMQITGGMVSMLTLVAKGIFSLMASFLLIATTSIDAICVSLRKIHVPPVIATLFLLTYRYISLMAGEVAVMTDAYVLRAPGHKGIHISAWGSFLGQLLLRSMDRAQEMYQSMLLRGFQGEFYYADIPPCTVRSICFTFVSILSILVLRCFNIPLFLGNLFM